MCIDSGSICKERNSSARDCSTFEDFSSESLDGVMAPCSIAHADTDHIVWGLFATRVFQESKGNGEGRAMPLTRHMQVIPASAGEDG